MTINGCFIPLHLQCLKEMESVCCFFFSSLLPSYLTHAAVHLESLWAAWTSVSTMNRESHVNTPVIIKLQMPRQALRTSTYSYNKMIEEIVQKSIALKI